MRTRKPGAGRDFGVKYNEHRTFSAGVRSHYRWLRYLGRAEVHVG